MGNPTDCGKKAAESGCSDGLFGGPFSQPPVFINEFILVPIPQHIGVPTLNPEATKNFRDKKIDFLFIDGDHSYEGVKKDFLFYSKCVRKDGIIAFHDIMKDNLPGNICDVDKFWATIKKVYKSREIIADFRQIGSGIGILCYDPEKEYQDI